MTPLIYNLSMKKNIQTKNQKYYCYVYQSHYYFEDRSLHQESQLIVRNYEMDVDKLQAFLLKELKAFYLDSCNRRFLITILKGPTAYRKKDTLIFTAKMEDARKRSRVTHIVSKEPLYETGHLSETPDLDPN